MQNDIAEMFLFPEITLLNTKVCIVMEEHAGTVKELVLFTPGLSARFSPTSSMVNGY